jgi:hypothetical protein
MLMIDEERRTIPFSPCQPLENLSIPPSVSSIVLTHLRYCSYRLLKKGANGSRLHTTSHTIVISEGQGEGRHQRRKLLRTH